jgi:hypothetical protein
MHASIDNGAKKWKGGVRGGPGAVTWDGLLSRGERSADEVERISDLERPKRPRSFYYLSYYYYLTYLFP